MMRFPSSNSGAKPCDGAVHAAGLPSLRRPAFLAITLSGDGSRAQEHRHPEHVFDVAHGHDGSALLRIRPNPAHVDRPCGFDTALIDPEAVSFLRITVRP